MFDLILPSFITILQQRFYILLQFERLQISTELTASRGKTCYCYSNASQDQLAQVSEDRGTASHLCLYYSGCKLFKTFSLTHKPFSFVCLLTTRLSLRLLKALNSSPSFVTDLSCNLWQLSYTKILEGAVNYNGS